MKNNEYVGLKSRGTEVLLENTSDLNYLSCVRLDSQSIPHVTASYTVY